MNMDAVWNTLTNINYSNIPIAKIAAVLLILTVTQTLRRFFVAVIIKSIEKVTSKTQNKFDDELIAIIKPALSWLILIAGFWLVKEILSEDLGLQLSASIGRILNLIVIFIVAYVVYRGSSILGQIIANVVLHTETELDELLRPLMPKIFQSAAIIILTIKVSEIFLGQSAAALVGLLGGAGITLGLLLKDIVYDWFCTLIIYSDNLYREGDWVGISGVDGFVQILNIGFRTTTLHVAKWGSIIKMPNSRMISGVVENWSQNPGQELKWGVNLILKIDGISAQKTATICNAIQEMPKSIAGFSPSCTVRFKSIQDNARVIEIMAFVNDDNLYFEAEKNLNLAILALLEEEGIDFLFVELETTPENFQKSRNAVKN
ncbi:MAG: mechanosensitive ion channel family protein [Trichormus sp.]